uniref:uncharacterized protein LOC120890425 n=1 Tax=Ictidomys tridecemlineatus TaxID=43179 RepID=UPI001A9E6C0C|nr:uncharacterized protein LOC120890425 [Ictidomys tridecemlineatus]XP_040143069.1 uncharacterized protein LOC120890425 [Ictidomys tridecemlineatus]
MTRGPPAVSVRLRRWWHRHPRKRVRGQEGQGAKRASQEGLVRGPTLSDLETPHRGKPTSGGRAGRRWGSRPGPCKATVHLVSPSCPDSRLSVFLEEMVFQLVDRGKVMSSPMMGHRPIHWRPGKKSYVHKWLWTAGRPQVREWLWTQVLTSGGPSVKSVTPADPRRTFRCRPEDLVREGQCISGACGGERRGQRPPRRARGLGLTETSLNSQEDEQPVEKGGLRAAGQRGCGQQPRAGHSRHPAPPAATPEQHRDHCPQSTGPQRQCRLTTEPALALSVESYLRQCPHTGVHRAPCTIASAWQMSLSGRTCSLTVVRQTMESYSTLKRNKLPNMTMRETGTCVTQEDVSLKCRISTGWPSGKDRAMEP